MNLPKKKKDMSFKKLTHDPWNEWSVSPYGNLIKRREKKLTNENHLKSKPTVYYMDFLAKCATAFETKNLPRSCANLIYYAIEMYASL